MDLAASNRRASERSPVERSSEREQQVKLVVVHVGEFESALHSIASFRFVPFVISQSKECASA